MGAALPMVHFTSGEIQAESFCATCTICLDDFHDGDVARRLPCRHDFHSECIKKWLRRSKQCPLCKYSINSPPLMPRGIMSGPRCYSADIFVNAESTPDTRSGDKTQSFAFGQSS